MWKKQRRLSLCVRVERKGDWEFQFSDQQSIERFWSFGFELCRVSKMRYLKGSKVEVFNTMDPTSPESWRPAEIVSGNGHTYQVIYDGYSLDSSTPVRVPRKAVRPCPPLVVGLRTWGEGDHVEVFEGNSWKPGVVAGKDGSCFSVTILGGSSVIKAHGYDVRVRQTWQDGQWIMTDKVDQNSDIQVIDNPSKLRKYVLQKMEPCHEVKKHTSRKMRAIGDNGWVQRRNVKAPYPIPEKVDAVISPCFMLGEKYMHASSDCKATALPELDMDRKLIAQHHPANTICSVVGSCSANDNAYSENHSDEVESSCGLGRNQSLPGLVGHGEETHQLELYAYRSTISVFYESGPLTWEKQALLTDLRLMLHISNDEHLMELRRLKSATA